MIFGQGSDELIGLSENYDVYSLEGYLLLPNSTASYYNYDSSCFYQLRQSVSTINATCMLLKHDKRYYNAVYNAIHDSCYYNLRQFLLQFTQFTHLSQ